MGETRIVGHDARVASNATRTAAEKIVRDAEMREGSSSGTTGQPVHETTSSYLGMTRKEAPSTEDNSPPPAASRTIARDAATRSPGGNPSQPVHETTSSYLGMKRRENVPVADTEPPVPRETSRGREITGGDDPAPFSSALGIPTLVNEDSSKAPSAPHEDNPDPFSKALHIPTLIHQSKTPSER